MKIRMKLLLVIFCMVFFHFVSCTDSGNKSDAFGNFEAEETVISSESQGKILFLDLEEGSIIDSGKVVCASDTLSLYLQKQLILKQKNAAASKNIDIVSQVNVFKEQKKVAEKELVRLKHLIADSAATQKQLDDIEGRISIIEKQIEQVENQNRNLFDLLKTYDAQIDIVNDNISKLRIINPKKGTVLVRYVEKFEVLVPGKPVYKIADPDKAVLRAYFSGSQISSLKIGQKVTVLYDKNSEEMYEKEGIITYISSKSEFTPKIIQTKEERLNFVYAVKILVENDGTIKIGMPGEVLIKN